jgi:hypothetical protein
MVPKARLGLSAPGGRDKYLIKTFAAVGCARADWSSLLSAKSRLSRWTFTLSPVIGLERETRGGGHDRRDDLVDSDQHWSLGLDRRPARPNSPKKNLAADADECARRTYEVDAQHFLHILGQTETCLTTEPWSAFEWIADTQLISHRFSWDLVLD